MAQSLTASESPGAYDWETQARQQRSARNAYIEPGAL